MDWRDKLDSLKSTLPQAEEIVHLAVDSSKLAIKHQHEPLRIELDKRKGKATTLISCFSGSDEALKELARTLKMQCSAGGSCKDGEILIQGDFRKKTAEILLSLGYKVKRINFK